MTFRYVHGTLLHVRPSSCYHKRMRHLAKHDYVFLAVCTAVVLLMYGQSLASGFVFDDQNIVDNRALFMFPNTLSDIALAPHWSLASGLYRPVTLLSYWANFVFTGNEAFGFHVVNLLLYIGIGFFIYRFVTRLTQNQLTGHLSALLFLVLPIHSEVVANITGRSELLTLFFSLLLFLEFARQDIRWWHSGLWMLLAIGSKETAIATLPIAILVLYVSEYRRGNLATAVASRNFFVFLWHSTKNLVRRFFLPLSALIIATGTYLVLRFFALGPAHFFGVRVTLIENPLFFAEPLSRIATAFSVLWMYVFKTFVPIGLCSDYTYNQLPVLHSFMNTGVLLGIAIFGGIVFTLFYFVRKKPVLSLSAGILLTSFLPVSNLLFPTGAPAGERWFFYPSFGIAILVAYFLTMPLSSKKLFVSKILATGVVIALVVYAFLTGVRQSDWLSNERLFASAVACAPMSVLSHSNLGAMYIFKDDYPEARQELETARDIAPIYSKGLNNLGLVYWKEGKNEQALAMYHEALKQDFPYAGAMENLALLYLSEGKTEDASRWLTLLFDGNQTLVRTFLNTHRLQ